eukprot:scaffold389398_cov35-Attheya_sp.AAC.1
MALCHYPTVLDLARNENASCMVLHAYMYWYAAHFSVGVAHDEDGNLEMKQHSKYDVVHAITSHAYAGRPLTIILFACQLKLGYSTYRNECYPHAYTLLLTVPVLIRPTAHSLSEFEQRNSSLFLASLSLRVERETL